MVCFAFLLPQEGPNSPPLLGEAHYAPAFSQTAVFGKFARTQLRPMCRKFNSRFFSATLPPYEKSVFRWRKEVIEERIPRLAAPRPRRPHWISYTDAATNHPMLCALLFHGGRSSLICTPLAPPVPSDLVIFLPLHCADIWLGIASPCPFLR